jgi:glycine/D-amino acid oxidase-like deaminating enzyme
MKPRKPPKLIIVGAGVMGSVVGHWARHHGHEVVWYDDRREGAGSIPSAGLIYTPWSPLSGDALTCGLKILDTLYGLNIVTFPEHKGKPRVASSVSPVTFLARGPQVITARVTKVGAGWVILEDGSTDVGKVLLATGSWVPELFSNEVTRRIRALAGTAFIWKGRPVQTVLREWAPYKQIMAFERDPGYTWVGDGTSILRQNYGAARLAQSQSRCTTAFSRIDAAPFRTITGYRPYIQGMKAGLCEQVMDRTWVLTGGGKSSTILAAHYAQQLLKEWG